MPPTADNAGAVYEVLKVAAGNVVVETATVGDDTVSASVRAGDVNGPPFAATLASVAVTETLNDPACVGVPEMTPLVGLNVRPPGRPVAANVYGPKPPVAVSAGAA